MRGVERDLLADALGIGWKGKGRRPWRNRTAHNTRNPTTTELHESLAGAGHLVEDPAEHYGRMRVYRVTTTGAEAIGKRLPRNLRDLVPEDKAAIH
jgi:hypothetical protein